MDDAITETQVPEDQPQPQQPPTPIKPAAGATPSTRQQDDKLRLLSKRNAARLMASLAANTPSSRSRGVLSPYRPSERFTPAMVLRRQFLGRISGLQKRNGKIDMITLEEPENQIAVDIGPNQAQNSMRNSMSE